MAARLRDMVREGRRNAARCVVSVIGLATLLAVLCVCFSSAAHHDETADRDVVALSAEPAVTGGSPAPTPTAEEPSVGHSCPPGERCASVTHTAGIALPAPEPSAPTTLGQAGLPAPPVGAHPAPQAPVHRHAPNLHVLQVQRI
ncbi:hypothetical protein [Streptomyces sp. NPDC051214]|uniref:hypothetical protein n=1 Tax=Streptomyces sp. NPDC051214 TaxID=3155282 RepID=UPI00343838F4